MVVVNGPPSLKIVQSRKMGVLGNVIAKSPYKIRILGFEFKTTIRAENQEKNCNFTFLTYLTFLAQM